MKNFYAICLIAAASIHSVSADVPKKAPLVKYTGLWTNSPFTSKPVVEPGAPQANPFDDYTLTGIAPVPGGYRITIISKKNPEDKKVIEPGGSDQQFKVISVNRNPDQVLGTTVVLASGSIQGTVSFEPDLITLNAAPAAAPPAQPGQQPGQPQQQPQANGNLPPGVNPQADASQANGGANQQRQPRPRIVAEPTPSAQQPSGNAVQGRSGGRDSRRNR